MVSFAIFLLGMFGLCFWSFVRLGFVVGSSFLGKVDRFGYFHLTNLVRHVHAGILVLSLEKIYNTIYNLILIKL